MSESNIESLRRLDRAFHEVDFEVMRAAVLESNDPEGLLANATDPSFIALLEAQAELLDPEVEIDSSTYRGGVVGAVRRKGFRGWLGFWREWLEGWEGFSYEILGSEQIHEHVVLDVLITARGRGSGAPVDWHQTQLWTFRDGRVIGLRVFASRDDALRWIRAQEAE
jgi:hypothetical protein